MTIAAKVGGVHGGLMHAEDLHSALMKCRSPACDEFDAHVVASIFAIALGEAAAEGRTLTSATGLLPDQLGALIQEIFPNAASWRLFAPGAGVERSPDEVCLLELLQSCTTSGTEFEAQLAAMIARRAQRPNHLWQDLGLRSRGDLSELMKRHFRPLALRNSQDMKWKKFLYRIICADASYSLCTAPSCAECDDFNACFGEETGESFFARARRAAEAG
jgi:nitrogen fixation protein NifQ